jgi:hypothetical protein
VKATLLHYQLHSRKSPMTHLAQGLHEALRCLYRWIHMHRNSFHYLCSSSTPSPLSFTSFHFVHFIRSPLAQVKSLGFYLLKITVKSQSSKNIFSLVLSLCILYPLLLQFLMFVLSLLLCSRMFLNVPLLLSKALGGQLPNRGGYLVVPEGDNLQLS